MGSLVACRPLPFQLFLCRTSVTRLARGRRRKKGSGAGRGREGVRITRLVKGTVLPNFCLDISGGESVSPRAKGLI